MTNNLIEISCPFCRDKQKIKELYPATFSCEELSSGMFTARRTEEKCHYRVVKCACGMVFSSPILPEEVINSLYSHSGFNYEDEVPNIQKSYVKVLKKLYGRNLKGLSVLEFGCGNGFFLKSLLKEGVKEIKGVEPSVKAIEMADTDVKEHLINGFIEDTGFEKEYFDIVCSFHVLDHVREPLTTVKKSYELCKKGGAAFFITHDTDALQAKILKDKSPIIDIEHIYLFNKATLSRLLETAGFKKVRAIDITNYYSLKYWVKMFPFPGHVRDSLLKTIDSVKLNNLDLGIKAGNIAVLGYK